MKPSVIWATDQDGKRLLFVGLRPSSLPQSEIDAFVKLYVKAPKPPEPPQPDKAA